MEEKRKEYYKIKIAIFVIVAFFLGAGALYGVIALFPTSLTTITTKLEKDVTVTETGIADAVEKVYDSVVVVSTYNKNQLVASGTGFVYALNGDVAYILTNNHVIEAGDEIHVTFTNGKEENVSVVGADKYSDIAVLSINKDKIIALAELGNSEEARVGDTAFAVGAPLDSAYSWTVTRGILSGKNRLVEVSLSSGSETSAYATDEYVMSVLQTDTAINSGNSGGPLANSNGKIIGITSLKLVNSGVEGMGFAIPIETAVDYARKLIAGEEISQPYLGVSMINVADAYYYREYYNLLSNLNITSGVLLTNIENNSVAEKAGLKAGDIVTKIGDIETNSVAYFRYALYQYEVEDTIKLEFNREGKIKIVEIKLTEKKTN